MRYPGVVQCGMCKKVLVSFDRHDFKSCKCPNKTFIDGGSDYLRVGATDLSKVVFLKIVEMPKEETGL